MLIFLVYHTQNAESPSQGIMVSPRLTCPPTPEMCFFQLSFKSFFILSLENPFKYVFHGKERVRSFGFLTVVTVIVWGVHYYVPIKHAVHLLTRLPFIFSINPAQGY